MVVVVGKVGGPKNAALIRLFIWLLYGYCMVIVWLLYGYCMVIVWLLYGYCMVIVWYGYCVVIVWLLYGYCMELWYGYGMNVLVIKIINNNE